MLGKLTCAVPRAAKRLGNEFQVAAGLSPFAIVGGHSMPIFAHDRALVVHLHYHSIDPGIPHADFRTDSEALRRLIGEL